MPNKNTIQRHTDAYVNIWRLYETSKSKQSLIIRSGYAICKIYDDQLLSMPRQELIQTRGESDLEHGAGMAILAYAFMEWFPSLFPQNPENRYRIPITCLTHDAGEIAIGEDIPNNGDLSAAQVEQKHQQELAFMKKLSDYLPPGSSENFLNSYKAFSNRDTVEGYFIHLIDKLEALLQHAFYMKIGIQGVSGDSSPRDIEQKAITESNRPIDNWTVDFIAEYEKASNLPNPPSSETFHPNEEVFRHCFGVLCAAAIDARGYAFNWDKAATLACSLGIPIKSIRERLQQDAASPTPS